MNTVFTLNTHIGTHIDAPRHFYAEAPRSATCRWTDRDAPGGGD